MNIGDRIKKLRKAEKLTQKEFSKKLCISQSYLSGLENGTETPTDRLLKLIELEFNVSTEWLKDGVGDMYSSFNDNSPIQFNEPKKPDNISSSFMYKKREYAIHEDMAYLPTVSNQGLLEILTALNTTSEVQYRDVTNIISSVGKLLKTGTNLPDGFSGFYLLHLSNVLLNIDKINETIVRDDVRTVEVLKKYLERINLSLNAIIDLFVE